MKISKKILSIFVLTLFAIALVGCGGGETEETTEAPTTEAPTTEAPTTEAPTTGDTTTEEPSGGEEPTFVGLFSNQTYYRGSIDYDILDGVKALDEEDGDITEDINVIGSYSLTRTGSYTVYVTVEDSDGNLINRQVRITVKDLNAYDIPDELTSDPIEIDLWHSNGATVENALIGYAEDFEALYPNVTVNIVANGANYDELRSNVVNAIQGGQLPNIVQNYPDHVMEYIDRNAVIPITPFIYDDIHGYNPDVEDESFL
ncbi:MAG: extracellular solute-binding protein, partial [Candidatus Izemoplasmatales bacterium]